jgi:hypothetical protein
MTDHKNCLQAHYNNGRRILCSQNWTKYMLEMSVTNQQGSIIFFSIESEDQGSMYSVFKSGNTEYCFFVMIQ